MTRSEEEPRVGKASRESGRARLRNYVVTEQVQQTVPMQREEVRIEREPFTTPELHRPTTHALANSERASEHSTCVQVS